MPEYSIGLDYGTNSVRAVLVEVRTGEEAATSVFEYPHGEAGILLDARDPNVARQHPQDYLDGLVSVVRGVMAQSGAAPASVVGTGVDTTGSTPMPVDSQGTPLGMKPEFADELAAMVYLWKDHTGHAEALEITELAAKLRPQYLAKCGGAYSAEWFWSKLLRCLRAAPNVFEAAHTWVEHSDWLPAVITGQSHPDRLKRDICAAGHKAMFNDSWGGYPDEEFLAKLDPRLARVRRTLPDKAYAIGEVAGVLSAECAAKTGLVEGTPVSMGAFDAHCGAVGSGIKPGVLVKIIGTSCCDMMTAPLSASLPDIPGLCGIVPESILPGFYGLEAGQSAVGDIFNWFVGEISPGNQSHNELTQAASELAPGQSGLLALDWHNGNRTILVDPRLSGAVYGLTLHTTPAEIYRAWIEATAFGARVIVERFEEYGQKVETIINCGGISAKNPLVMQIYADVIGRPLSISRSTQTCALGAAIAGAVAGGAYASFDEAIERMTGVQSTTFVPIPRNRAVYDRLFTLYRRLHDAFGVPGTKDDLSDVMKRLLQIRDEANLGK